MKYLLKIIDSICDQFSIVLELLFFPIKIPFLLFCYVFFISKIVVLSTSFVIMYFLGFEICEYLITTSAGPHFDIQTEIWLMYTLFSVLLWFGFQLFFMFVFDNKLSNVKSSILNIWSFNNTKFRPVKGRTKNFYTMRSNIGTNRYNRTLSDAKNEAKRIDKKIEDQNELELAFSKDFKPSY